MNNPKARNEGNNFCSFYCMLGQEMVATCSVTVRLCFNSKIEVDNGKQKCYTMCDKVVVQDQAGNNAIKCNLSEFGGISNKKCNEIPIF